MTRITEDIVLGATEQFEQQAKVDFLRCLAFLRTHPTLTVSIVYLLMSAVGLYYSSLLMQRFQIDILPHLEATDFMLATLHQPTTFIVCSVFIVAMWLVWRIEQYFRRFTWMRKFNDFVNKPVLGLRPVIVYITLLGMCLYITLDISAEIIESQIRSGKQQQYNLVLSNEVIIDEKSMKHLANVQIIADSAKYLWVYLIGADKVLAVPQKNVGTLTLMKTKQKPISISETPSARTQS